MEDFSEEDGRIPSEPERDRDLSCIFVDDYYNYNYNEETSHQEKQSASSKKNLRNS
jgi:hypothetical protein